MVPEFENICQNCQKIDLFLYKSDQKESNINDIKYKAIIDVVLTNLW